MSRTLRAAGVLAILASGFLGLWLFAPDVENHADQNVVFIPQPEPVKHLKTGGKTNLDSRNSIGLLNEDNVDLSAVSQVELTVSIVDEFSRPLPGVFWLGYQKRTRQLNSSASDSWTGLVEAGLVNLLVTAPGYANHRTSLNLSAGSDLREVLIRMKPLADLEILTVGSEGSPISGVRVSINEFSINSESSGITNEAGQYNVAGLKPGYWRLSAQRKGFWPLKRPMMLLPGQTNSVKVPLARSTVLKGRVLSDSNSPIIVEVFVGKAQVRTVCSQSGLFEIEVPVGDAVVIARDRSRQQFARRSLTVGIEESSFLELSLAPGACVSGVVKFKNGQVAANLPVTIFSRESKFRWHAGSDSSGRFSSPRLGPGRYIVEARSSDESGITVRQTIELLRQDREVELELPVSEETMIQLRDSQNRRLENWHVRAFCGRELVGESQTDHEGVARILLLKSARVSLHVFSALDRKHCFVSGVSVPENGDPLIIRVGAFYEFRVEVRDNKGQSLVGVPMDLYCSDVNIPALEMKTQTSGDCRLWLSGATYRILPRESEWNKFQLELGRTVIRPQEKVVSHSSKSNVVIVEPFN